MLVRKPTYTEADLERVLVTAPEIQERVRALGCELSDHYRDDDVTVISILSGALVFTADLLRCCEFPTRLDCLRAESYGYQDHALEPPRITSLLKTEIENHHVLIVDDILDSGNTLRSIICFLQQANPASLKTCVLLDKPSRHPADFQADFRGFTIPDAFVVGYGLDFAERYRHLPCIGVLKSELQNTAVHA